jgi:putative ATPase
VAQQYLPAGLQGKIFYAPSAQGYEAEIRDGVLRRREIQIATALEPQSVEILTFSPASTPGGRWIERLAAGRGAALTAQRERIFTAVAVPRHARILDADARTGLLLWEALRRAPEGGVWGIVRSDEEAAVLEHRMGDLEQALRPALLRTGRPLSELDGIPGLAPDVRFELIVGRNLFTRMGGAERAAALRFLLGLLAPGGTISVAEIVPRMAQRLSDLVDFSGARGGVALREKLAAAEETVYSDPSNPLVGWGPDELAAAATGSGARAARVEVERYTEERHISARDLDAWLSPESAYGRALAEALTQSELASLRRLLERHVENRDVRWMSSMAFLAAGGV